MTAESASTTLGTTPKTAEGAPVNGAAQVITLVIGARKVISRPGTRSSNGIPRWSGRSAAGTG